MQPISDLSVGRVFGGERESPYEEKAPDLYEEKAPDPCAFQSLLPDSDQGTSLWGTLSWEELTTAAIDLGLRLLLVSDNF